MIRVAALSLGLLLAAESYWIDLPLRSRKADAGGNWTPVEKTERIEASKTAIIICDMWDQHWCSGATKRVAELAGHMNPFLEKARSAGVLIVHAPSETVDFYKDYAHRAAILTAPHVAPPAPVEMADPPLPIDDKNGGCDTGESFRKAWSRETPLLTIAPQDVISDSGEEIYSYLRLRGIDHLLIMGVHTNMCVLNRSFAIKRMTKWGMKCVLVRDLTDSMYNPADWPHVSHQRGTEQEVEHIEKYWAPSVESGQIRFTAN